MTRRVYCEPPLASAATVVIDGSEAHHLLHVLRASPGMHFTLFDGRGWEFDAEVARCGRSTVDLVVGDRREANRELPFPLTLGVPLPKGDRQRWIVEKAVELGVTRLVSLATEHTAATGEKTAADKLSRYVIEASKQCGRNRLMEIAAPQSWATWLAAKNEHANERAAKFWVAHPTGRAIATDEAGLLGPAFVAVGPEGGLTDVEAAAARESGWELISLGPRLFRIETAAIALASLLTLTEARASQT